MLIDLVKLAEKTKPDVFRRGQMLHRLSTVQGIQVRPEKSGDFWIQGQIKDGATQKISIRVNADHNVSFYDCTCPAKTVGVCQHVVALAHAANQWKPIEEGEKDKKREERRNKKAVADLKQSFGEVSALDEEESLVKAKHEFLDGIRLRISYDRQKDTLNLTAFAEYGSISQPLLEKRSQAIKDDQDIWHVPEREWEVEQEAYSFIVSHAPLKGESKHEFQVMGLDIFEFVRTALPELEYHYTIRIEPNAQHIVSVATEEFTSDWRIRESTGLDWLSFSVEWQSKTAHISLEQLESMVESGKPYIRKDDGSFVECANVQEIEDMLEMLQRSKRQEDGSFLSRLYLAPELFDQIRSIRQSRVENTSQAFDDFLKELKEGKPIEPVALSPELEKNLRPYQKEGIAWMHFLRKYHFGGILADDMGLGKTAQILGFLDSIPNRNQPSIVVCPKTLLLTWKMEAQKFTPHLKVLVVDGLVHERQELIKGIKDYDLIITSYSMMQRDLPHYINSGVTFFACMLDEAQYIKNARSQSAEVVKLIPAAFRLALTGTPLENGVHELWSIFDFLMPQFLGDAKRFTSKFERPIREKNDKDALDKLRAKIRPFLLRRIKENLLKDLPPKIEQVSYSTLTPEQVIVYSRALQEVRKEVFQTVQEKGFNKSRIEILASLTKLRRICDHPTLVDPRLPRSEELSGKMALCMELVRQAVEGNHKVLLFSQYTSMLDIIREALNAEKIDSCTIEGKTRDRQAEIDQFCKTTTPVFLLSLRAGGTGLTLTAADTVILFDPWWNPQVERQAMDRAHRMGQTKTVNVYKLVTQGTIEEKVLELQGRKQRMFDSIMTENADLGENLTWEDVQGLLK